MRCAAGYRAGLVPALRRRGAYAAGRVSQLASAAGGAGARGRAGSGSARRGAGEARGRLGLQQPPRQRTVGAGCPGANDAGSNNAAGACARCRDNSAARVEHRRRRVGRRRGPRSGGCFGRRRHTPRKRQCGGRVTWRQRYRGRIRDGHPVSRRGFVAG
jgi:hypothetical protein